MKRSTSEKQAIITIRMDRDLVAGFHAYAASLDRTFAQQIRRMISEAVAKHKAEEEEAA